MVERTVGIVQARMGSTRLPGKVLKPILGEPMLARVVERTKRARKLKDIVIATTTDRQDESIIQLCEARGWAFFRGSQGDVLDRYYRAAVEFRADSIVRITSDCPLIDSGVIDQVVGTFLNSDQGLDYVSNTIPARSFPRGLDVEVFSCAALQRAWEEDKNPAWREHVTLYINRHPELFRLKGVMCDHDWSEMRWTVDTTQDLEFARNIYAYFGNGDFSWQNVLAVLETHPEWLEINREIRQKPNPN